ncbi:hypothetical protein DP73_16785 [Desulfosporosinus sp. HMP52]|uniref:DUF2572 family protein n=1 Tax=Desulfosporosinus sp. HMP52 TaxID=1487923 RepID=UPI00051FCB5E|nr:DUF2572 family protein [Desulfosporosinus sp. HMP52]KGK86354.1 hypothetical protein DP73_16785 [Desulfosporosinus sp. HMP52]
MRFWTRQHLKSEKGNALLMALSIIMILTAFGTASLMTSVANIQMSTKYRNWSKDYYVLDKNVEAKVDRLNSLLQDAESKAQAYMSGQYYLYPDTAPLPEDLEVPQSAQEYLNGKWTDISADIDGKEDLSQPNNQAKLKSFMNDTVKRLYYYYASQRLFKSGYTQVVYLNDPNPGNYQSALFSDGDGGTEVLDEGNLVVAFNSATAYDTIGALNPGDYKGKKVSVKVDVRFPAYEVQEQTKSIPYQGNPVWANAITAGGNIGFEGSASKLVINGDIFAADRSESLPIRDDVVTDKGIYSRGAEVNINGNVYSKGNLHVIDSNSKIYVNNYPSTMKDTMNTMKNNIFSENGPYPNLFFDLAAAGSISSGQVTDYIEGHLLAGSKSIPLVYQDGAGGNVYCNSLVVEEHYPNQEDQAISNGEINVDGNVTTYNDIRMDGLNSTITVAKNVIGVNSTPDAAGNPNASSSIINNTPLKSTGGTESTITLKGNFIIPGTAFAKYNGSKKAGKEFFTWSDDIYYQTGESISASNTDIFSAYMAAIINPLEGYNYYYDQYTENPKPDPYDETKIHSYYFMRGEDEGQSGSDILEPKIKQLVDFLKGKNVVSNILVTSPIDGYSLGTALIHQADPTTGSAPYLTVYDPYDTYANYIDNQNAYGKYKRCLASIFEAKTQKLGTTEALDPEDIFEGVFVDKSALDSEEGVYRSPTATPNAFVYSQAASTTLDLSDGDKSGIIYCEGNLNITGSGKFNGTIICEGNVMVSGSSTVTYNEDVIKATLQSYSVIRDFFAPGNRGELPAYYVQYTAPAYDGAVRKDVIRYKILEWKEQHQ